MFTTLQLRNSGAIPLWVLIFFAVACSKSSSPPPNPCAGVAITINGTVTHTSGAGAANGAINATASGSVGITYSLNGGAFQVSGTFTGLTAGNYLVTARNSNGCSVNANFVVNATDPCAGKSITVTTLLTASDKCSPTGSVSITALGSTGFTYKLNASGTYQSSNNFTGVPAGNHVVYARDAAGCEQTSNINIAELPTGAKFNAVATLLRTKCTPCHTSNSEGGANYNSDCNIVALQARIKSRAVDIGDMPKGGPPLSTAEKQTITDWIASGGMSSN